MKALARSHVWWPGLDKNLEERASACQSVKQAPAAAPLHPWIWPTKPWQRVHINFAGPFQGKMYFLAVDAHSKWPEVVEMSGTTSAQTIAVLRRLFAAYGLPEQIVSDNGPQFVLADFQQFLRANGVKHIRCSPYHPASNGAVERFVRTFKQALKAGQHDGRTTQHNLHVPSNVSGSPYYKYNLSSLEPEASLPPSKDYCEHALCQTTINGSELEFL